MPKQRKIETQSSFDEGVTDAERYILGKIKAELEGGLSNPLAMGPKRIANLLDSFFDFIDAHYSEADKANESTLFGVLPNSLSIKIGDTPDLRISYDRKQSAVIYLPKINDQTSEDEESRKLRILKHCFSLIPLSKLEIAMQFIRGLTREGQEKLLKYGRKSGSSSADEEFA